MTKPLTRRLRPKAKPCFALDVVGLRCRNDALTGTTFCPIHLNRLHNGFDITGYDQRVWRVIDGQLAAIDPEVGPPAQFVR